MTQADDAIRLFLEQLNQTPDLWRSLDMRLIVARLDGSLHVLVGRCRIDARKPRDVPRLKNLPCTENLACLQEIRPVSDLRVILHQIIEGELQLGGESIYCRTFAAIPNGDAIAGFARAYVSIAMHEHASSRIYRPSSYVAHVLNLQPTATGSSLLDLLPGGREEARRVLRSLEYPFDGVNGLSRVALQSRVEPEHHPDRQIEIVAPLGVAFERDDVILDRGRLEVSIWAASPGVAKGCGLGFIGETERGSYENGTIQIPRSAWSGGPEKRAKIAYSVSPDTRRITLFLRLGPRVVETLEIEDRGHASENLLLAAYALWDPGLVNLRNALAPARVEKKGRSRGGNPSREFEHAVARLFSLAGFQAEALGGYSGNDEAVDVLIHTPTRDVLIAAECTIGSWSTSEGKPAKLVRRRSELRHSPSVKGPEVLAMLVTARPRDEIPDAEIENASHDGLITLCQEDLFEILAMVESGTTVSEISDFCRNRVARSGKGGGFPFPPA